MESVTALNTQTSEELLQSVSSFLSPITSYITGGTHPSLPSTRAESSQHELLQQQFVNESNEVIVTPRDKAISDRLKDLSGWLNSAYILKERKGSTTLAGDSAIVNGEDRLSAEAAADLAIRLEYIADILVGNGTLEEYDFEYGHMSAAELGRNAVSSTARVKMQRNNAR